MNASQPSMPPPEPLRRRVLTILHDPRIPSAGGRPLHAALGWNDPDALVAGFLQDLEDCSHGLARYGIVDRVVVDAFPPKVDGFAYEPEDYLRRWHRRGGFHEPDGIDYRKLLAEHEVPAQIDAGLIDEVWLMGFPYAGYYESIMAGPGAFWCNAPPLTGKGLGSRRYVIMGFNYERGIGEMLESFGHRAESILARVFEGVTGEANLWERFTRHEKTHPGRAEVGNIHFAPNSRRDYDWGRREPVLSRCDAWLDFPNLETEPRWVDCEDWGGGDIRLHHLWWFRRLPHVGGATGGISNNWWEFILDPGRVEG